MKITEQIVSEGDINLYSISIKDSDVSQADNDNFYYHYSVSTYEVYINEFLKALKTADIDKYNFLTNIVNDQGDT